jgi:FSR family fosmidomycin resistance protein-like MFS transporter
MTIKETPATTVQATLASQQNSMAQKTVFTVLFTISFSHLLNDMMQSVIPSIYPIVKDKYHFSFTQIGFITLAFQLTASILQPFVGAYTDRKSKPFSLTLAMVFSLAGIIALSLASSFISFILAVCLIGLGSSVFHPEASRVAYLASGGKKGLAQSIFQLGGNAGSAIGPLLAAIIVLPHGQLSIIWFSLVAILGMVILFAIGKWYQARIQLRKSNPATIPAETAPGISKNRVVISIGILLVLIFSKFFYMASMTNYFTFYLIEKFNVTVEESQYYLFSFLAAVAIGTIIGGPIGDRFGRKYVIWFSILGAAPFTLLLPYVNLFWTVFLAILIGIIIASAFSAILVYATDLVPGKIGMIAGLFFGFTFGMAGIGSAVLGWAADKVGIEYVFKLCAYLPLIGIITVFLPNVSHKVKS